MAADMRRAPLGLLLALAVARSVAAAGPAARRESAAEVARAIAGLRRPRARAEAVASGPARVYVVVRALTAEARAALEAAGLAIELPPRGTPAPRWRDGDVVQGLATPDAEARIRALPFVVRVEPPGEAWTNVGAVTSAGDAIVFGPQARATLGTSGAGVTVGVLSDGVDHAATRARRSSRSSTTSPPTRTSSSPARPPASRWWSRSPASRPPARRSSSTTWCSPTSPSSRTGRSRSPRAASLRLAAST
jgi:stage V sporulation protein SpoVS